MQRENTGYARSRALVDAASIVQYWWLEIPASRNNVTLQYRLKQKPTYAQAHRLIDHNLAICHNTCTTAGHMGRSSLFSTAGRGETNKVAAKNGGCGSSRIQHNQRNIIEENDSNGDNEINVQEAPPHIQRPFQWCNHKNQNNTPRVDVQPLSKQPLSLHQRYFLHPCKGSNY